MYIEVYYEIKDRISDKAEEQQMQYNGIEISITYEGKQCIIKANGDKAVAVNIIRTIWELAFLYDGYFYRPKKYIEDGQEISVEKLYFLQFYKTDKNWYNAAVPLHENIIHYSEQGLHAYDDFRNISRDSGKLIKSLLNAFYYLHAEAYEHININHRLSLLLNICDGYIINTSGETNNVEANIKNVLGQNLDVKLVKYGADLLGIPKSKLYDALAQERNEIDHYTCKEGSLADYVFNKNDRRDDFINWYFTYVIELALRIGFLKQVGYECPNGRMLYAMNDINDWIILECDLPNECKNPLNKMKQDMRKMGIDMR